MKISSIISLFPFCFLHLLITFSSLDAKVIEIKSEAQFKKDVLEAPYAVVDFFTTWCPGCSSMKGPFEEISNMPEFSHITFAKVDIDAVESVGAQFNITQIPSFVYFKKGMKAFQKVGGSKNTVISDIRSHLPAPKLPVASPASTSLTTTSKKTRTETIVEEPKTLDNSATTYEKIKKETVVVTHEKKDTESFSDSAEEFFEDVGDRVENWGERVERWGKDMWRSIKRFFKG